MRLEKINDRQIRCTLNQKDLKDREIGITELAYGTPKAKALFRDMMEQASYEFGFDTENIPLMIEAIPLLPEALVLVITKVEDPDELDTRFSCFTEEDEWTDAEEEQYLYAYTICSSIPTLMLSPWSKHSNVFFTSGFPSWSSLLTRLLELVLDQ